MDESQIPKPFGDTELPPIPLADKMEKLCLRLDALHSQNGRTSLPSEMVRGALFAARSELRKNPEWFAQAMHSLRETLYPLLSKQVKGSPKKTKAALKSLGVVRDPEKTVPRMHTLYREITNLAHHGKVPTRPFEDILLDFENVIGDALGRQSDIHVEIDDLQAPN